MLRRLLKNLAGRPGNVAAPQPPEPWERAPLQRHFEILFGDTRVGDQSYAELFWRCANDTDTAIYSANLFRRAQAGIYLIRYFLAALPLAGLRAECGVYRGMSSLLMCRAARTVAPDFGGERLHLFDSFERFSAPTRFDLIETVDARGIVEAKPPFPANSRLDTSLEAVQHALAEFPALDIRQGWLPQTLYEMPEAVWSFVHVDVDLYEPTRGALEYFYPRLATGGIIITDDYGSTRYPGACRAWDEYCSVHNIAYIVLGTGQAVIIRDR